MLTNISTMNKPLTYRVPAASAVALLVSISPPVHVLDKVSLSVRPDGLNPEGPPQNKALTGGGGSVGFQCDLVAKAAIAGEAGYMMSSEPVFAVLPPAGNFHSIPGRASGKDHVMPASYAMGLNEFDAVESGCV
jgi:hypothetical protein